MDKPMTLVSTAITNAAMRFQCLPVGAKRACYGGFGLLGLLLATTLFVSGGTPVAAKPYLHRVEALQVSGSDHYQEIRLFSGRVNARQHADMGFEQGGKLAEVLVDEGELVERGAVLAILDSELLRIEEREQLAQLRETKARLKLTENSLTRQTSLKRSGFTSEQRIDELNSEKETLLATLARLDAAAASVATRVRKNSLLAPFDGVVTHRFADQGGAVNPAQTVLRLQQSGAMEAHIGVPLQQVAGLLPGSVQEVRVAGHRYAATVLAVGADLHPLTRTVMVRLGLDASVPLVNGELATLTLISEVDRFGYWVPASAMSGGVRGLWNVMVLSPEADDEFRLEARAVATHYALGQRVFISGDLGEGESIVALGLQRVVAGQRVRLQALVGQVEQVVASGTNADAPR